MTDDKGDLRELVISAVNYGCHTDGEVLAWLQGAGSDFAGESVSVSAMLDALATEGKITLKVWPATLKWYDVPGRHDG